MEDKAEKDLDQVSDCSWVRGLDVNGNSIQISKVDLVELIRETMPVATIKEKGLMSAEAYIRIPIEGDLQMDSNFNTIYANGTYVIGDGVRVENDPFGHIGARFLSVSRTSPGYIMQELWKTNTSLVKRRYYNTSTWSEWI